MNEKNDKQSKKIYICLEVPMGNTCEEQKILDFPKRVYGVENYAGMTLTLVTEYVELLEDFVEKSAQHNWMHHSNEKIYPFAFRICPRCGTKCTDQISQQCSNCKYLFEARWERGKNVHTCQK